MLHSPDDEIIPYELGRKLYAAARQPKMLWELHGDHNGGFMQSQPEYEQVLMTFVAQHLSGAGRPEKLGAE